MDDDLFSFIGLTLLGLIIALVAWLIGHIIYYKNRDK